MKSYIFLAVFSVFLTSHIPVDAQGSLVEVTTTHKEPYDLPCSSASHSPPVTWWRGETEIKATDKGFEIIAENQTLRILKIEPKTAAGPYVCKFPNGTEARTFSIKVRPSVEPFDKVRNVIEGDPLTLYCKAWGIPTPVITWERDGILLEEDGSKKVSLRTYVAGGNEGYPDVENGTIRVVDLNEKDQGNYSCFVTSSITVNGIGMIVNATIVVQVKDKYAALWPFLGICAEVAILCTIILIYERRRAKRIEEEERQEESTRLNTNNETRPVAGNDDVRQRK